MEKLSAGLNLNLQFFFGTMVAEVDRDGTQVVVYRLPKRRGDSEDQSGSAFQGTFGESGCKHELWSASRHSASETQEACW